MSKHRWSVGTKLQVILPPMGPYNVIHLVLEVVDLLSDGRTIVSPCFSVTRPQGSAWEDTWRRFVVEHHGFTLDHGGTTKSYILSDYL